MVEQFGKIGLIIIATIIVLGGVVSAFVFALIYDYVRRDSEAAETNDDFESDTQ